MFWYPSSRRMDVLEESRKNAGQLPGGRRMSGYRTLQASELHEGKHRAVNGCTFF